MSTTTRTPCCHAASTRASNRSRYRSSTWPRAGSRASHENVRRTVSSPHRGNREKKVTAAALTSAMSASWAIGNGKNGAHLARPPAHHHVPPERVPQAPRGLVHGQAGVVEDDGGDDGAGVGRLGVAHRRVGPARGRAATRHEREETCDPTRAVHDTLPGTSRVGTSVWFRADQRTILSSNLEWPGEFPSPPPPQGRGASVHGTRPAPEHQGGGPRPRQRPRVPDRRWSREMPPLTRGWRRDDAARAGAPDVRGEAGRHVGRRP